jgi:hypothetical protein
MCPPSPSPSTDENQPDPVDIVCDILREVDSLQVLLEVHYLILEPGLLEIMRRVAAVPDEDRRRLLAYLSRHSNAPLRVRELPAGGLLLEPVA